MIFDRRSSTSGLVIDQDDTGVIEVQSSGGVINFFSSAPLADDNWHHVVLTYDAAVGAQLYIDGVADNSAGNNAGSWAWPVGQQIELGLSHDSSYSAFGGQLDEVRIYNRQLTGGEVTSVYNSAALVDTAALKLRLNFDSATLAPGVTVSWQNTNATLQSAGALTGPWTSLPAAISPYRAEIQTGQIYFRYIHTPVSIKTNPYDM